MGIGVVIFLSAAMFRVVSVNNTQQGLIINAEKIKSGIRLAQANSLSIPRDSSTKHICGYGITKSPSSDSILILYYLYAEETYFKDNRELCNEYSFLDYDNGDGIGRSVLQTIILEDGYEITAENDIFFKTPYGEILEKTTPLNSALGVTSFEVINRKDSKTLEVEINSAGKIYIK